MSDSNVIRNSGDFFVNDAVELLSSSTLLSADEVAEMLVQIRDHFQHHHAHLNNQATAEQVGFFFVNRTLHVLGYTHSHNEPLGDDHRIEYTMFNNPDVFSAHVASRGTLGFFNGAVAIGKVAAWAADLDEGLKATEDGSSTGENHAFDLEEQMRLTNLPWAILTNGRVWRLYHKNTAAMVNAFFEVDLLKIIQDSDLENFKIFANTFCAAAISADKTGSCENKRLLA
ncbi:MAG: hypothetical protein WC966_00590 [Bradymonadales bacterium]|jgi:hypothetical protein